jgi:hypothetical protein
MLRYLLVFLTLLLAAVALAQPVTLTRRVAVGDTLKYRATIICTVYGNDVTYKALLTERILQVDRDGSYTVQTTQSEITATNGDRDLPISAKDTPVSSAVYGAGGNLVQLKSSPAEEEWRLGNLSAFHLPGKPIAPGESWTAEIQPSAQRGNVGAIANYKFIGLDKVGAKEALRITESYKETRPSNPATSEAKIWVDATDGSVLKLEADWNNAPILGLSTLVRAHLVYEREF